jgi:hypothetical protein
MWYHYSSRIKPHPYTVFCHLAKLRGTRGRMSSTLVGTSGRVYVRDRLLKAHPSKPELNIYVAQ